MVEYDLKPWVLCNDGVVNIHRKSVSSKKRHASLNGTYFIQILIKCYKKNCPIANSVNPAKFYLEIEEVENHKCIPCYERCSR